MNKKSSMVTWSIVSLVVVIMGIYLFGQGAPISYGLGRMTGSTSLIGVFKLFNADKDISTSDVQAK